jgi:hypothetical protein
VLQLLQTASLRVIIIATAAQGQQALACSATETESMLLVATVLSENMTISYPNSARTAIRAATIAL